MQHSDDRKYRFLILGGCGFIGRHLVDHLISNGIASKVRIVDKTPPQLSWLNKHHKEIFSNESVEFKSSNLINEISCQNAYTDILEYDFAINLAAETRYGQEDAVYKDGILKLSINCAKEAAKRGIKYVEISSGQIGSSDNEPLCEHSKAEPWTLIAKYKHQVENELTKIKDLDYVILRPAIVYGIGDKYGITPRLTVGAVYKHLNETMKLLWNRDLKMNTVHVDDMCRAIWYVCRERSLTTGQIYNLVDTGNTTQGIISDIISEIFDVEIDYWGKTMSLIAFKSNGLQELVEEINEKHLNGWSQICSKSNILNTPINPYLYPELLQEKHLHLNGKKLQSLGFAYSIPIITKETVIPIIADYVQMNLFPELCSNP